MFPSFILSLREGLEAALLIGIVLVALAKFGRRDLNLVVWRGVIFAVVLSLLAAGLLQGIGTSLEGRAEEIYEGTAMIAAAILLTWMIFWMRRQGGSIKGELENGVRNAVSLEDSKPVMPARQAVMTTGRALFLLAFLAIAREGFELALFLTASAFTSNPWQTALGALAGLSLAAGLGFLLFTSTRRLSLKKFFLITNILLILFAAGLVAHGVHEFNEAGLISPVIEHVWDINGFLNEKSTAGLLLAALFGYNGNPSLTEVLSYALFLLGLSCILFLNPLITTGNKLRRSEVRQ